MVLLAFVGVKMILAPMKIHIPVALSLGIIVAILATGIVASLVVRGRDGSDDDDAQPQTGEAAG